MPNTPFEDTYVGRLRAMVGPDTLLKLPGACVLLWRDDGALLMELSHHASGWRLPGGIAEEAETLEECARRELWEETGLEVGGLTPFAFRDTAHRPTRLANGDVFHSLTMLFVAHTHSGALVMDELELQALDWFQPDALPEPLHGAVPAILEAYQTFQNTGVFQIIYPPLADS